MKILKSSILASVVALCSTFSITVNAELNKFELPKLNYSYSSLEPYIDAETMNIHYNKHHQAYVNNLNKAVLGTEAEKMSLEDILKNVSKFPDSIRNNAGGHWNHTFFWNIMTDKKENREISSEFKNTISKEFGSFDNFQKKFEEAGSKRFGSGWVWLLKNDKNNLEITSTPNQDNPLMDIVKSKGTPILACDVWEHAYYLKYQNKRGDYLKAFWNIVNWKQVEENYKK